ncbi:hypothetical protein KFL_004750110 [Klebsormidium nitens]|uniref:Uncharacterized protein n=1 Tax=Klebsormidium nitens TaxID=105231 RepID=A0A1Y1IG04_KLENI|nr:hypothetical protein KFL_004750110 [Klebsormidium nitens]|eukprot:GAQ88982.1 hypothetical protein KFL_004750110 [Klebsormidium nitens]
MERDDSILSQASHHRACVLLVKRKDFGQKEHQGTWPEIDEFCVGLSAWYNVFQAAIECNAKRPALVFMAVVNPFLAKWAPKTEGDEFKGFLYDAESSTFSIDKQVWGSMHEHFKRDFDAAKELDSLEEVRSSSALAKILALMMVNFERERQIWLRANRTASDAVRRTPCGRVLADGEYAPPADWRSLLEAARSGDQEEPVSGTENGAAAAESARSSGGARVRPGAGSATQCDKCGAKFQTPRGVITHLGRYCPNISYGKRKKRPADKFPKDSKGRESSAHSHDDVGGAAAPSLKAWATADVAGDQLREDTVTDVAAMIASGVSGILREAAKRARARQEAETPQTPAEC